RSLRAIWSSPSSRTRRRAGSSAPTGWSSTARLAGPHLADVRAPTLLVVGGADGQVLDLNRRAQAHLRCENRLEVVPGATHLFEEPGALDRVAELARDWFTAHLAAPGG
ncbi:hypothetical protein ACWC1D_36345, partial [Streptomyces sp. NPDC001478]